MVSSVVIRSVEKMEENEALTPPFSDLTSRFRIKKYSYELRTNLWPKNLHHAECNSNIHQYWLSLLIKGVYLRSNVYRPLYQVIMKNIIVGILAQGKYITKKTIKKRKDWRQQKLSLKIILTLIGLSEFCLVAVKLLAVESVGLKSLHSPVEKKCFYDIKN